MDKDRAKRDLDDAWTTYQAMQAEARNLDAEAKRIWDNGYKLRANGKTAKRELTGSPQPFTGNSAKNLLRMAEIATQRASVTIMEADGLKLLADVGILNAKAESIRAAADKGWAEAILAAVGDVLLAWFCGECTVETVGTFSPPGDVAQHPRPEEGKA